MSEDVYRICGIPVVDRPLSGDLVADFKGRSRVPEHMDIGWFLVC